MTRAELPSQCTAKQGAAFLQVSLRTWHRLERAGSLPTHRLPSLCRSVRYDGERLARYGTPDDIRARAAKALRAVS